MTYVTYIVVALATLWLVLQAWAWGRISWQLFWGTRVQGEVEVLTLDKVITGFCWGMLLGFFYDIVR